VVIGVLAFQGDVIEHMQALSVLGAQAKEVRSIDDLKSVQGLIIPGGESTVIGKFLEETGLRKAIIDRCTNGNFPIYGTCAGAILLAKEVLSEGSHEERLHPLGLMDIAIERNAYGRQTESFEATLTLDLPSGKEEISGIFIRAPKVVRISKEVRVLGMYEDVPVALHQGSILISTFHPELSGKPSSLHKHFLGLLKGV
jgi:5'-phosphate synthase pdxT subunit